MMIKGIYSSASGMQYLQLKQEITANNLANVSTTGFKKEGVFRKTLMDREKILRMNATDFVNLEEVDIVKTDYSRGSLSVTNNPLDFAIDGNGFFAVETLNGIRYTRNGNFILDGENYLVTTNGYRILNQNNQPIQIAPEGEVFISDDGSVTVNGEVMARLKITDFPNPYNLLKMGDGLFYDLSNLGFTPQFDTYRIRQGVLEESNVNAIEEMAKMINTIRDFDTNQRSILAQDQTLDRAVNEIAKMR
jgi:flagellar basal-body rod protein FlgG